MSDDPSAEVVDPDLYHRTQRLLKPGDIELEGLIIHSEIPGSDDMEMTDLTIEIGDIIASHATDKEVYVYSGTDDPEFASNQHQGLTIDGDEFVWECQQLLRNGTYDIVFYYEAETDSDAIVKEVTAEYEVQAVPVENAEEQEDEE
ncbi:hypothetical protein K0C01_01430 [Salinarchaeum sp. IM2453]|uniref:DUF5778 family protein n=1 Tax=Salinarchaeum sp. IM2453 TaxID=2862870 RepID=UPI001C8394CF|nr:DUF5778 family protein [Salinarchaeum sp. IM2453]QZA88857.1 hypothetical protein K0C01_01430 [Salinarchaeum sp. IM2453]